MSPSSSKPQRIPNEDSSKPKQTWRKLVRADLPLQDTAIQSEANEGSHEDKCSEGIDKPDKRETDQTQRPEPDRAGTSTPAKDLQCENESASTTAQPQRCTHSNQPATTQPSTPSPNSTPTFNENDMSPTSSDYVEKYDAADRFEDEVVEIGHTSRETRKKRSDWSRRENSSNKSRQ